MRTIFTEAELPFGWLDKFDTRRLDICEYFHAKIEAILKDAPRIYGDGHMSEWFLCEKTTKGMIAVPGNFRESQHTALIWPPSLEPIVQEHDCKPPRSRFGEGDWTVGTDTDGDYYCGTCMKKLVARWERKEK